jgi:hypothetical protein
MDANPSCLGRRVDPWVARGWLCVAVLMVLCVGSAPARASFPGRNGAIVYAWTNANKEAGSPTSLRAVDPRSGRVRTLLDCPLRTEAPTTYPDCSVLTPRYSPDGLRIAFSVFHHAYPPDGPWGSWAGLGLMTSEGAGVADHPRADAYWRLAWSPTGDRLLVERAVTPGGSGGAAIFLASLDGTELSQVTPEWTRAPDWSSTGWIAFDRVRTDAGCFPRCEDIWVMLPGGDPRRVTYRGGYSPSWSPRGRRLAFVRRVRPEHPDIYLVGADGSGLRRLTRRGGHSPAWSPDGKWIAFIRDGDVYVVRTTGGGLRRLVDELGPDEAYGLGPQVGSLDWQPLGQR